MNKKKKIGLGVGALILTVLIGLLAIWTQTEGYEKYKCKQMVKSAFAKQDQPPKNIEFYYIKKRTSDADSLTKSVGLTFHYVEGTVVTEDILGKKSSDEFYCSWNEYDTALIEEQKKDLDAEGMNKNLVNEFLKETEEVHLYINGEKQEY